VADSGAHTVYVDREPVAYHHAKKILNGNPNATIQQADIREVDQVLDHEDTRGLQDAEISARFDGMDLVPPGLVMPPDWRNEDPAEHDSVAGRWATAPSLA
jgi:S-adenosyl methyltransferase